MKIEKVCVNFLAENGVVENGHFWPLKNKRLRCTLAYRVEAYRRSRGELIQEVICEYTLFFYVEAYRRSRGELIPNHGQAPRLNPQVEAYRRSRGELILKDKKKKYNCCVWKPTEDHEVN